MFLFSLAPSIACGIQRIRQSHKSFDLGHALELYLKHACDSLEYLLKNQTYKNGDKLWVGHDLFGFGRNQDYS